MLVVREVRALAGNLSDEDFQRQVGPFVLVRRPPDPKVARVSLRLGVRRTRLARSQADTKILVAELLQQFDDLHVATLPPIHLSFGDGEFCFLETHTLLSMLRTAGNY